MVCADRMEQSEGGHVRTSSPKLIQLSVGNSEGVRFEPTPPSISGLHVSVVPALDAIFDREKRGTAGEDVTTTRHGLKMRVNGGELVRFCRSAR